VRLNTKRGDRVSKGANGKRGSGREREEKGRSSEREVSEEERERRS